MKEQIINILNELIKTMTTSQKEYESNCYERGLYPKSLYERIYSVLYNDDFIEDYLIQHGVDISKFEEYYLIFDSVRNEIKIPEEYND